MKKIFLLLVASFLLASANAQTPYVIYNGEDINTQWSSLASNIQNNVINPVRTGINTSEYCVAIERVTENVDPSGVPHSGGALWNANIPAGNYNCFSLMVLKQTAGMVHLELQCDGMDNEFLYAKYTTPGQWQKLVFPYGRRRDIQRILIAIHEENAGSFPTQMMYWDNFEAYYIVPAPATDTLIIYDGEEFNVQWEGLASDAISNNVANPAADAVNPSAYCVSIFRDEADVDPNGKPWTGGALWNKNQVNINPVVYNRLSIMVKKDVAGRVVLELQKTGEGNQVVDAQYTNVGQWQRLTFDISCRATPITKILVQIHSEAAGSFTSQNMYWDNLTAYYEQGFFDISGADTVTVYDGETVIPNWNGVAANINNNVVNPVTDGINPSAKCISIERDGADVDPNGKMWSGGSLWACSKVQIDPAEYQTLSLMVLKNTAGKVGIELQSDGGVNTCLIEAEYTNIGQWQELTFNIPVWYSAVINNILVQIHREEAETFATQTMYWDNFKVFKNTSMAQSRYTYETFETSVGTLNYRKLAPAVSQEKYPLVIFLHGAGERGVDNARQLAVGGSVFSDSSEKYPAYVLFPQCDPHHFWPLNDEWPSGGLNATTFPVSYDVSTPVAMVKELIDEYLSLPDIDSNRVYISGLSMGGFGSFDIVARYPSVFAAAVPICGGINPARLTGNGVKNVYWRIFHGALDTEVPVSNSRKADSALTALGADVEYIEYSDVYHNVWDNVFARPDYLSWMFSKVRKGITTDVLLKVTLTKKGQIVETKYYNTLGVGVKNLDTVRSGVYIKTERDVNGNIFKEKMIKVKQ